MIEVSSLPLAKIAIHQLSYVNSNTMSHVRTGYPFNSSTAENLWQKALETLDEDLRASLDFDRDGKLDILKKTLRTAEQKKQICLRKRLKFKKGGKEVVVRDVLEKIIRWVEYFKVVGDVAVQYDPIHASLPWAGVRFLLKVSI